MYRFSQVQSHIVFTLHAIEVAMAMAMARYVVT